MSILDAGPAAAARDAGHGFASRDEELTAFMNQVEQVEDASGSTLAIILRTAAAPSSTTFVTPPETDLQVGLVVYPEDGVVQRHYHLPVERHLVGTTEVLVVRNGRCVADLFDREQQLVATKELAAGDVILLLAGGHGFRMLEDTVLLEVKQGPYTGLDEKERF